MLNLGQSLDLSTNLLPMQIVNAITLRSNSLQLQPGNFWGSESLALTGCRAVETRARLQQHWETGCNLYQLLVTSANLTGEPGMEAEELLFLPGTRGRCVLGQGRRAQSSAAG